MRSLSTFGAWCAGVLLVVACGSSSGPSVGDPSGTPPVVDDGKDGSAAGKDVGTPDPASGDTGTIADTGSSPEGSSSDTGSTMPPPDDAGSDTGPGATCTAIGTGKDQFDVTGKCASCLAANCCTTLTTCVKNSACLNLVNCAAACDGGSGCQDGCGIKYLGGDADAQKFGNCESAMCGTEC
jgi:hypothetical protein